MVQEEDIEVLRLHYLYGFHTGRADAWDYSEELQEIPYNLAVHLVVICNKYARRRILGKYFRLRRSSFRLLTVRIVSDRCRIDYGEWKLEEEIRTFAVFTFYLKLAVHHLEKLGHDRDTEAGSFYVTVLLLVNSFKGDRQLADILFLDTDTGILYGNKKLDAITLASEILYAEGHTPFFSVFYSICEEVHDDLTDPYIVAEKAGRDRLINIKYKLEILGGSSFLDGMIEAVHEAYCFKRCRNQVHPSVFNLGEVQDGVDDGEESISCGLYI